MALDPRSTPSKNFSLTNWKITLPVDKSGSMSGTATEIKSLSGYQHSQYFYTAGDGAMVFTAPVEGATTSGSKYARSELREMKGADKAAWTLKEGGVMSATLEVDHAPIKFNGAPGRVVVGQIHGQDDELVRLYWENNKLYFANDQAGANNSEAKFYFYNASRAQPNVSLNERFSYKISAKGSDLEVTILADGQTYTSTTRINDVWQSDKFYFKAGTYLGVNETQGKGYGQTSFYALSFGHGGALQQAAAKSGTIKGGNGKNTLSGTDSANAIYGYGGNDKLNGGSGNDKLIGGSGKDAFIFNSKLGTSSTDRKVNFDTITDFSVSDDTIWLDNAIFKKLGKPGALKSSYFTIGDKAQDKNDYILYNKDTGALSYDADGWGKKKPIEFAQLSKNLDLTHKDFVVT